MKFDENVEKLLKKYPLNEDLGNIFGTLGQMVKNKMKYILEPMTKPFDDAKPDLSKGDDIIQDVADALIQDPNNSNKKIKFLKDGKEEANISYVELIKFDKNSGASKRPEQIAKQIIKVVDLNDSKQRLNVDNPVISKKIQEIVNNKKQKQKEYGEEQTRADIPVDRLVQRYKFLIKNYFKPFISDEIQTEKQKWLYILANNNQEIKFSGDLSTMTPSTSGAGTPAPTGTTTPSPSGSGTPAPAPARTRTPITRRQRTP